jgi:hypothetical protein
MMDQGRNPLYHYWHRTPKEAQIDGHQNGHEQSVTEGEIPAPNGTAKTKLLDRSTQVGISGEGEGSLLLNFKTSALNRSATLPSQWFQCFSRSLY